MVADASYSIFSSEVLQHFDLLVGVRCMKIVDRQSSQTVNGSYAVVKQITPRCDKLSAHQTYTGILCDYPIIKQRSAPIPAFTMTASHLLGITGHRAFSRPHRQARDKFRLAKAELDYMLNLDIIWPFGSLRASPIHMASKYKGEWQPGELHSPRTMVTILGR